MYRITWVVKKVEIRFITLDDMISEVTHVYIFICGFFLDFLLGERNYVVLSSSIESEFCTLL